MDLMQNILRGKQKLQENSLKEFPVTPYGMTNSEMS